MTVPNRAALRLEGSLVRWFEDIAASDIAEVGGKAANLGELLHAGFPVPPGFAVTTAAYLTFLSEGNLRDRIRGALATLNVDDTAALQRTSNELAELIRSTPMPVSVQAALSVAYRRMTKDASRATVAVRSSATSEDSAQHSFAGMFESFLNVSGEDALQNAVRACWASTMGARILFYRAKQKLQDEAPVAVVVQQMIPSLKSGVMFTVDPSSHNPQRIVIEAAWGLGEVVVGGQVTPDRYVVDKQSLRLEDHAVAHKEFLLERGASGDTMRVELTADPRADAQVLNENEIRQLADIGRRAENHYGKPQDMEFAIAADKVYVVQTRPITTLSAAPSGGSSRGTVLLRGLGASPGVASGAVRILMKSSDGASLLEGEVLVAPMTSPDWVPIMRRAKALITDAGGMTSHAAIVSRELGIPCVVGAATATRQLQNGMRITVNGSSGEVLEGTISTEPPLAVPAAGVPGKAAAVKRGADAERRPVTATRIYVNLAEPERAQEIAALDVDGVGLLRAEFMLLSALDNTHPRLLLSQHREQEFVERMEAALRTIASAFAPRPVIYRATDFRSNEFRHLTGGEIFEPQEENPMIGYRGCYRYTREPDLFLLELRALARVRRDLPNIHLMIPFVRTLSEVRDCLAIVDRSDLSSDHHMERWLMAEVPSVVYWLDKYAELGITGVSIGSNDLTQLMLGVDRDSALVAPLFDERDAAVLDAIESIVTKCRKLGIKSSICGQAPSVHAEYAEKLVKWGIDSISVNADVIDRTRRSVAAAEQKLLLQSARRE